MPTITPTSTAGNDAVEPCSTPLPTEDTDGVEEIVDAEDKKMKTLQRFPSNKPQELSRVLLWNR